MIGELAWISLGAVLGANLRFGLIKVLHPATIQWHLPFGVLLCNCFGSLVAGALWMYSREQELSILASRGLMIGFLGSLTTFSTFAVDSMALSKNSSTLALLNVGVNIFGSLGSAVLGGALCKRWLFS
jgi:fluoride exporter